MNDHEFFELPGEEVSRYPGELDKESWIVQRQDDLIFDEHAKGRHDQLPLMNCPDCVNEKMAKESNAVIRDYEIRSSKGC